MYDRTTVRIRKQEVYVNRFVLAALVGTLVWFADQPTVSGYNPLFEMFWDSTFWQRISRDHVVLLLSWLVTTLFCHFVLFTFEKFWHRHHGPPPHSS